MHRATATHADLGDEGAAVDRTRRIVPEELVEAAGPERRVTA
jgi:hypothetical protein